jgi:two-component system, NarL family, invasion response regulator UvrY
MVRLLIADDHEILREGLKYVVSHSRDISVVGEADNAESTLQLCRTTPADVLLLDVSMPGPGVLDTIKNVKGIRPGLRILVLSVHPEEQYARRVLAAGADGYLTKNHSSRELAAAVRQVHNGKKYLTPSLAQELALDLARGRNTQDLHETLSNREYQTLLQLGAGKGIDEIAQLLNLSPKTVRTYRARIMEKMNLKSTAEIIFYVLDRKLITELVER